MRQVMIKRRVPKKSIDGIVKVGQFEEIQEEATLLKQDTGGRFQIQLKNGDIILRKKKDIIELQHE